MSRPKQGIVVLRSYTPASDQCARALELLLKKSVKEGGPTTAPDSPKGGSNDSRAKGSIP